MPVLSVPGVAALPIAPNSLIRITTYNADGDAFFGAMQTFGVQLVGVGNNVFANANDAVNSANIAAGWAETAANWATNAAASANAAAGSANAAPWVASQNYAQFANAISRIDFLTYRCMVAGGSASDPKNDPARWVLVSNTVAVTSMVLQELQPIGVGAGNGNTTDGWYKRNINTLLANSIEGSIFGQGGVIKLPQGTYDVYAVSTQKRAVFGRLHVNVNDTGAKLLHGQNTYDEGSAVVCGQFVLAVDTNICFWHYIRSMNADYVNMLGSPIGLGPEVYSTVVITKVR